MKHKPAFVATGGPYVTSNSSLHFTLQTVTSSYFTFLLFSYTNLLTLCSSSSNTGSYAGNLLHFNVPRSVDLPGKMLNELAEKYADVKGGYTRIIKLGKRRGDNAEEVILQLI